MVLIMSVIDNQILSLQGRLHDTEREMRLKREQYLNVGEEIIKLKQKKLSCLVGKAFKNKRYDEYFVVTEVPKYGRIRTGDFVCNIYQIPILFAGQSATNKGEIYIGKDTVFSNAVDADDVLKAFLSDKYEEISVDEFYNATCELIKNRINNIKGDNDGT